MGSTNPHVVLLGASGYVGSFFCTLLKQKGYTIHTIRGRSISNSPDLIRQLSEIKPDFLINCSGYTGKPNVDACEAHKTECLMANAVLPGLIREACRELKLPWGHVSSGCIFTGNKGASPSSSSQPRGFTEMDIPNFTFRQNNCSFYSGTKALGEETLGFHPAPGPSGPTWQAEEPHDAFYIWRMRIPFHHTSSPRNYLSKLMHYERLLDARNSLSQIEETVNACLACFEKKVPYGIYHVTNPGSMTTREIVELIRQSAIGQKLTASGKTFLYFDNEKEFHSSATIAPRSSCVLETSKLESVGIKLPPVQESLSVALKKWT